MKHFQSRVNFVVPIVSLARRRRNTRILSGLSLLCIWGIGLLYTSNSSRTSHWRVPERIFAKAETQGPELATESKVIESPFSEFSRLLQVTSIPGLVRATEESKVKFSITLSSDSFFQSGTASSQGESLDSVRQLATLVTKIPGRIKIAIEGHTDDSPVVRQRKWFPTNWELSAARAASFVRVLIEEGLQKDQLEIIGYGDSRPILPNREPSGESIFENMARNRRIVLTIRVEESTLSQK